MTPDWDDPMYWDDPLAWRGAQREQARARRERLARSASRQADMDLARRIELSRAAGREILGLEKDARGRIMVVVRGQTRMPVVRR